MSDVSEGNGEPGFRGGTLGFDRAWEQPLIAARRDAWGERKPVTRLAIQQPVGLALSGGGIRSATFSLGLAQALAEKQQFPRIDYLSTVSGGGYTGAFLSALFLPRKADCSLPDPIEKSSAAESALAAAERAEQILSSQAHLQSQTIQIDGAARIEIFHPLRWLRENGRYLTPSGAADTLFMFAFYLRSLIGVHYVLGLALFGFALAVYSARLALAAVADRGAFWPLADAARFAPFDWAQRVKPGLETASHLWASPMFWLPLAVVLAVAGPLILTYWTVYRQEARRRTREEWSIELGPWLLAVIGAALALRLQRTQENNWLVALLAYGAYLGGTSVALRNGVLTLVLGQSGWATESALVARARLRLTQWLTLVLGVTFALLGLAVIDSFGQSLFVGLLRGEWMAWGSTGAGTAAAVVVLRRVIEIGKDVAKWGDLVVRFQKPAAMLLAVLALVALGSAAGALVQAVVWSWTDFDRGVLYLIADMRSATAVGWHASLLRGAWFVWLLLFALTWFAVGFLNSSTFHRFYAARLTRTFLGAANFKRLQQFNAALAGGDEKAAGKLLVSESHVHDDVALRSYFGAGSAAPLHLINATLNEAVSLTSNLQREDRKGVPLCVGPLGIGARDSFWPWREHAQAREQPGSFVQAHAPSPKMPRSNLPQSNATVPGDDDARCERLGLGPWAAISGAAVSTGLGALSSPGFSILAWLVNARLGYWWQPAALMCGGKGARARWPNAYRLVQQEMSGNFRGRRDSYWNLSDGGHFENTAVYELVRRRAALVICSDNGADTNYDFPDVQNLVRRVRVDFGTDITFLDRDALDCFCKRWFGDKDADACALFGTLEEFHQAAAALDRGANSRLCAALATIDYPGPPPITDDPSQGLLVLIKPHVTRFAPVDVQLYARDEPSFPHQSTGDQFFDEAQWESYRKLGLEVGRELFDRWDTFEEAAALLAQGSYDPTPEPERVEQAT